jgi:hypothetical protein
VCRSTLAHVCLSPQPFEDACCTDDGVCFDLLNIVPYIQVSWTELLRCISDIECGLDCHSIRSAHSLTGCHSACALLQTVQKFKTHPVTGAPLSIKDLTRLNFHKNGDSEYHCPITFKVFTQHSHIVAGAYSPSARHPLPVAILLLRAHTPSATRRLAQNCLSARRRCSRA